jgi:uncharacterized protein YegP (UPF0339 family)
MAGKYELYKGAGGQFRFRLKAGNGENILASEAYTSKHGAQNGIASVQSNSQIGDRYEERTSTAGQPYFVLKAANHEIIGTSEMYSSTAAMRNGIASVKANGSTNVIDDKT